MFTIGFAFALAFGQADPGQVMFGAGAGFVLDVVGYLWYEATHW